MPFLKKFLGSANIGYLKSKKDVEGLGEILRTHDSDQVRKEAANALGSIQDGRAIEFLISSLNDKSPLVRDEIILALANLGEAAIDPLTNEAMANPEEDIQVGSIKALGHVHHPRAVESLLLLLHLGGLARMAAANALNRQKWQPTPDSEGVYYWMGQREKDECKKIGPQALEPLIEVLQDKNESMNDREFAARVLGMIGDELAVEPLASMLKDRKNDWNIRTAAIEALGQLREIDPISEALDDAHPRVQGSAELALMQINAPAAHQALAGKKIRSLVKEFYHRIKDPESIGIVEVRFPEEAGFFIRQAMNAFPDRSILEARVMKGESGPVLEVKPEAGTWGPLEAYRGPSILVLPKAQFDDLQALPVWKNVAGTGKYSSGETQLISEKPADDRLDPEMLNRFEKILLSGEAAFSSATDSIPIKPGQFFIHVVEDYGLAKLAVQLRRTELQDSGETIALAVMAIGQPGMPPCFEGEDSEGTSEKLNRIKSPAILYVPRKTLPHLKNDRMLWSRVAGISGE